MNETFQATMAEATRLTMQGQLAEATALIQRSLGAPASPSDQPHEPTTSREPIEGSARLITEDPPRVTRRPSPRPNVTSRPSATGTPVGMPSISGFPDLRGGRPRSTGAGPVADSPAGRFLEASYTGPAGTRAYRLYVPRTYTGHAAPLLIMLHGCTQNPEDFATGTQMNALAEREGFLVAYPAQAAAANPSRCWNWFEGAHQARAQGEPALIAGITHQVMAAYNVDAGRLYVAGLSAGGAMAAVLGVTYPDLYAAVGVHSGLAYSAAGNMLSAMTALQSGGSGPALASAQNRAAPGVSPRIPPLILFHGERDTTVSPRNADQLVAQWLSAQEGAGAPETREQLAGGQRALQTIYRDAGGQTLVEQWRVEGLGHAWFGGSSHGSYAVAQGPDASAEMARFFREHPRG